MLPLTDWLQRAEAHEEKISPWLNAFRKRRETRNRHPVYDFLFEYYQCNKRIVSEWHPPVGYDLEGAAAERFLKDNRYSKSESGIYLNLESITEREISLIKWVEGLLQSAQNQQSLHHCYGMHEWAMVYQTDSIRHQDTPLRLPALEIQQMVKSQPLRCTHYDAFRFFSKLARPLNHIQPQSSERHVNEHFGCIHFNMDLFKWSYKLHPWISSELMADCFCMAIEARELDMRASPYDLRSYGFEPIAIETPAGRKHYQEEQKQLGIKARELASNMINECRLFLPQ